MAKLNVRAFGLSLGIVWGAGVLIMGITAMFSSYSAPFVASLSKFYLGYEATVLGSIIGAVWGFVDAGIGGVIIAWLYNKFQKQEGLRNLFTPRK